MEMSSSKIVTLHKGGMRYDYFFNREGNENLIVLMPSALSSRDVVPKFSRWSWMKDIECFDSICVSDPTLFLDDEILGGWFQGNKNNWVLEEVVSHIYLMATYSGYKNIVFHGSSLGGFSAIQSVILMKRNHELDASFLVENPQIDLRVYQWKRHRDAIARVSYGEKTLEDVGIEFNDRLNVIETFKSHWKEESAPVGIVVSKESDSHHHYQHVIPFFDFIKSKSFGSIELKFISKEKDKSGHTPLNKENFLAVLRDLVSKI